MKFTIQKSRLQQLIAQRNGYLVLAAGLLVLCALLSFAVISLIGRERIVVTPPVIKNAFWLDHSEVSAEYLYEMANFFAQLRLTVTPSSAAYQREALLRYTDARYYGVLKNALVLEAEHLAQSHISMAFYPVSIAVNTKQFTATITGDLIAAVGNVPTPSSRVCYKLGFSYESGRLLLQSFEEVQEKLHA